MRVRLDRPWLIADLGRPRRVLSFAPHRGGIVTAARILWREVRNADLTPELDVTGWFSGEMARIGEAGAVGLLTSRDIGRHFQASAEVDGLRASALATVGLGNAERVGARRRAAAGYGTINIAVVIEAGLTDAALLEAMTIACEARTAAVMEAGLHVGAGLATGTGTDCIAIAADAGALAYAGLHTALGEAVGHAVHTAVSAGAEDWMQEHGQRPGSRPPAFLEEIGTDL